MYRLHVGWLCTYVLILLSLLAAELYGLAGREHAEWTLTHNTVALVQRAPWMAVPVIALLLWLLLHFGLRLLPVLLGRPPITWI